MKTEQDRFVRNLEWGAVFFSFMTFSIAAQVIMRLHSIGGTQANRALFFEVCKIIFLVYFLQYFIKEHRKLKKAVPQDEHYFRKVRLPMVAMMATIAVSYATDAAFRQILMSIGPPPHPIWYHFAHHGIHVVH